MTPYKKNEVYEAVNQVIEEMEGETWVSEGRPSYNYLLDKLFINHGVSMDNVEKLFSQELIREYFSDADKSFNGQIGHLKAFLTFKVSSETLCGGGRGFGTFYFNFGNMGVFNMYSNEK